jgi:hypothetical protein
MTSSILRTRLLASHISSNLRTPVTNRAFTTTATAMVSLSFFYTTIYCTGAATLETVTSTSRTDPT